jgi:uncharacterized membrane-anchored protein
MRAALVLGGLVLALGVANVGIAGKERLLATGTTVLVELAPVDPRSLIQGDYMRLDYALARAPGWDVDWPRDGRIVVELDANNVAQFVRRHEDGSTLEPRQHLLRYRLRSGRVRIGTDAFYFQEGHAERYESAKYGELRVDDSGSSVLVGLRDGDRRPLGAP